MESSNIDSDQEFLPLHEEKGKEEKVEVSLEDIIDEYVGGFGYAQLIHVFLVSLHVFLVSLAWFFDAQHTLVTIFADKQPGVVLIINPKFCMQT